MVEKISEENVEKEGLVLLIKPLWDVIYITKLAIFSMMSYMRQRGKLYQV